VPKRRLAFIKSGLFSHINASVHQQLAMQFPELEIEEIDIWSDLIDAHRSAYWFSLVQAALYYPQHFIAQRGNLALLALRTPYLFRKVREFVAERLNARRGEFAFTFQTQSIFDASTPGVPHFVFTDHAHFANLRYPAFPQKELLPERWTQLETEIYQHASHVFVMSDHVRDTLGKDYGLPSARVTTVHGGSNVDPSPAPLQNGDYGNRTVVFVGIDWERKGGPVLAQAFAKVHAELPDARLIVVGHRPGLGQPWCEEIGKVPPDEVKGHLLRSSVFCLPTRIEPFGVAVIEAFAHRLPAVVSNVGAMPTLVRHGESGLVVPPDDADALASALCELLTDPGKCRRFGEVAYRDVTERYSWEAVGRKLRAEIVRTLDDQPSA